MIPYFSMTLAVFLLCQLWIVNYQVKSLSNNLTTENIKSGVAREMMLQKELILAFQFTFRREKNRNTSVSVFRTEIIW